MKYLVIFVFIVFLSGCANSPFTISMKSPEQLKSVPDIQLCDAYASFKNDKLKNELISRAFLTDKEWLYIEKQGVFIGMSKKALFAARPNIYLKGFSNIGNYGMCDIYSEFATTAQIYIYVKQDKVVGYQIY